MCHRDSTGPIGLLELKSCCGSPGSKFFVDGDQSRVDLQEQARWGITGWLYIRLMCGTYLVGGLEHQFYFPIYWECHHPNWRSYFSEGFKPPTRYVIHSFKKYVSDMYSLKWLATHTHITIIERYMHHHGYLQTPSVLDLSSIQRSIVGWDNSNDITVMTIPIYLYIFIYRYNVHKFILCLLIHTSWSITIEYPYDTWQYVCT